MWAQCIKLFSVFQNIYVDSLGLKYKFRCEPHQRRSFFSEGDVLWRMRGVKKPYFSIYERKKNPPCSWKAKQGKIHMEIPVFEWSVAATSCCCLPAPQSRANRDERPRRQLVHQRSMTNASANTSKQAAKHVHIIFYHFYLMWIGQKIWDAGHDVDFQNWLAFSGHWKPFLWHFSAELKLISAIGRKMRTKLRHINHRLRRR